MGTRVVFIDRLNQESKFRTVEAYGRWRDFAGFLDDFEQGFANVGVVVNLVNQDWDAKAFADWDSYKAVYNMMVGEPYDPLPANEGLAFITNEDYEIPGLVDIRIYDATYQGPFDDFSVVASGPAGMSSAIAAIIKATLESKGATLLSLDIMETTTERFWNLPIYANYRFRVFYHGSPVAPLLLVAIIAALLFLTVVAWRVGSVVEAVEKTKQVEATTAAVNSLTAALTDPNIPADVKKQIADAIKSSLPQVTASLNIPPAKSPFEEAGNLLTKVTIGVGVAGVLYLIVRFLPAAVESLQRKKAAA